MVARRSLWLSLAALHLLVIALSAFMVETGPGVVGAAIDLYGAWTGAGAVYTYFAPEVSTGGRVRFHVIDHSGRATEFNLGANRHELDLRLVLVGTSLETPKANLLVARSLAALAFAELAEAERVTVRFEDYDLPTIGEARNGRQGEWTAVYSAEFIRNGSELVCTCSP
jgi:hypothetical protein